MPQTIAPLWKITRYFLLPLENVLRSTELCKSLDIMWKWKWKKYLAIILKTLHYIIYTSYQIILSIQCKSPSHFYKTQTFTLIRRLKYHFVSFIPYCHCQTSVFCHCHCHWTVPLTLVHAQTFYFDLDYRKFIW